MISDEKLDNTASEHRYIENPFIIIYAIAPTVGDTGIGQSLLQLVKANTSVPVHIHTPAVDVFSALPELEPQDRVCGRFPRVQLRYLRSPLIPLRWKDYIYDLRHTGGLNVLPKANYEDLRTTLSGCVAVIMQGGPAWNDRFLAWRKVVERWLFMEVARHYGCSVYHVGVGAGPFSWGYPQRLWMKPLVRSALNQYTSLLVRDRASKPAIGRMGASPTVVSSTDTAVYLKAAADDRYADVEKLATQNKSRPRLAVCVRDYQSNYPQARQCRSEAMIRLAGVLDRIQRETADVYFLSTDHHTRPAKQSDVEVARHIQTLMEVEGSTVVDRDVANAAALKHIYGQFDGLLSMRLHPCIFALELGVPCLVISYDQKCDDFFSRLGLSDYVFPLYAVDVEEVARKAQGMFADASLSETIRTAYTALQEQHRHDYDSMFEDIRARTDRARRDTRV